MSVPVFRELKVLSEDQPVAFALILAGVFTLLRLILLPLYQTSLGPDEAQYWYWSRELDWGYYSKPPMIAWVIALPTAIFGSHEWSVRLLSPLLIGGTAVLLALTGRAVYGDKVAVWSAVMWLLFPAVLLGSAIMSTDIPLLFFWSASLFFLVRLIDAFETRAQRLAGIGLGLSLGLGFLSKYAMIYFPLGWALACLWSAYGRQSLKPAGLIPALIIAGLVIAPNIAWNISNDLQTLSHTADNANWQGRLGNPDELLQFIGDQFGVAGPFLFLAFLVGIVSVARGKAGVPTAVAKDRFLLALALPPLLIICGQAFLSRANANWAMTAYPAATLLTVGLLVRWRKKWVLWASVALHAFVGLMLTAMALNFSIADGLAQSNAVKRLRGWETQAAQIASVAQAQAVDAVLADERELTAHLVWEWRREDIEIYAVDTNGREDNTYELAIPLQPEAGKRYLLVRPFEDDDCAYSAFGEMQALSPSFVDLNATRRGRQERTLDLFLLSDFDPSATPGC